MSEATPRLGLPYLIASQAQKEITHNEALNLLDFLVQPTAIAIANTPPTSPAEGDLYVIGTAPSGVWSKFAGKLAGFLGGVWTFIAVKAGYTVWVQAALQFYYYTGSSWSVSAAVSVKATAAPTTGTYNVGDTILNAVPVAGSYYGWICVNAGTPGNWKGFGLIET